MKFVVVVEKDKRSATVGPYANRQKAEADASAWNNNDGRSAWVEPVITPEAYRAQEKK